MFLVALKQDCYVSFDDDTAYGVCRKKLINGKIPIITTCILLLLKSYIVGIHNPTVHIILNHRGNRIMSTQCILFIGKSSDSNVNLMNWYLLLRILRSRRFIWARVAITEWLVLPTFTFFFLLIGFLFLRGYLPLDETS